MCTFCSLSNISFLYETLISFAILPLSELFSYEYIILTDTYSSKISLNMIVIVIDIIFAGTSLSFVKLTTL